MKILIAGATGLIGQKLAIALSNAGHEIHVLTRNEDQARKLVPCATKVMSWTSSEIIASELSKSPVDGAINLAGENIGASRWTEEQKLAIVKSRIQTTKTLIDSLRRTNPGPKFFICASAIGFYGDTENQIVDEASQGGDGFLAETCQLWENAARGLESANVRTCLVRLAPVLCTEGGILQKMLPLFNAGLGGPLGSGDQWMSWIAMDDAVEIFKYLVENEEQSGIFNAVAPTPCSNSEFAKTLGKAVGKQTPVRVPSWAMKLALGEIAETILMNQKVKSSRLTSFPFRFPTLDSAIRNALQQGPASRSGDLG